MSAATTPEFLTREGRDVHAYLSTGAWPGMTAHGDGIPEWVQEACRAYGVEMTRQHGAVASYGTWAWSAEPAYDGLRRFVVRTGLEAEQRAVMQALATAAAVLAEVKRLALASASYGSAFGAMDALTAIRKALPREQVRLPMSALHAMPLEELWTLESRLCGHVIDVDITDFPRAEYEERWFQTASSFSDNPESATAYMRRILAREGRSDLFLYVRVREHEASDHKPEAKTGPAR